MTDTSEIPPRCPVGEDQCEALDRVEQLERKVGELTDLVRTDPLTGIPNLRHFTQALEQEMERTRRSEKPTSLIMLDLDYFKKVNDTYGHEVGNQALKHVAGIMVKTLRRIDIPCRYGGEEFAIILAHTDLSTAVRVAERLRLAIEHAPLPLEDERTLYLTASLGVDVFTYRVERTVEQLIESTDQCLYQAKQAGRNCVRHAPEPELDTKASVSADEKAGLMGLFGKNHSKED